MKMQPQQLAQMPATTLQGLSEDEVVARRAQGLGNTMPVKTSRSYVQIARENIFNPINNLLYTLGIALALLGKISDALISVGVVSLNVTVSVIQEVRAKRTLDRIAVLTRPSTTVIRSGKEQSVDPGDIVMGDVLLVRPGDQIVVGPGQQKAQNVRYAGADIQAGAIVFARGQLVRPAELGMIASLGIGEVSVYRKLRVAFFSTGDELVSIGGTLGPGQIFDSNRYTLYGMLTRLGVEVLDMGVIRDDPMAIEQAFTQAARAADVVITSGGVSVGEADFVKQLLARLGDVLFWKIAMKPGRPLAYGKIDGAHFFGLPGNPVAVMVTFYQFVRDALLILMGVPEPAPIPALKAVCVTPIKKAPGRTEFQRGILSPSADGQWTVRVTGDQSSGILSSMSQANCFIVLPDAQGNTPAGTTVDVQILDGLL